MPDANKEHTLNQVKWIIILFSGFVLFILIHFMVHSVNIAKDIYLKLLSAIFPCKY